MNKWELSLKNKDYLHTSYQLTKIIKIKKLVYLQQKMKINYYLPH